MTPEAQQQKKKNFCASKYTRKWKDNPQKGRKCLQIMYFIRD